MEKIPVFLISGGFRQLNVPLAHRLNIPSENVFSVELLFDSDGKSSKLSVVCSIHANLFIFYLKLSKF